MKKKKTTTLDMTAGPITKQVLLFAVPLILGNIFQMLYNTVDSVVVGNFVSTQALAAVGSTTVIVNILVFFFNGFSIGVGVVVGNYFGAKNLKALHSAIQTSIVMTFFISIIFTAVGVLLVNPMLRLMTTPEDVFNDAAIYLRIYFAGISGLLFYNMGSGILRAVGDTLNPLYFLILTSVLNIVLDLIFVLVFKAGISGVAYATIISQFVSAALILLLLTRTDDVYRFDWKDLHVDFKIFRRVIAVGLPTGIQSILTATSNVFVQSYINFFGTDCMAGWGCYNKLDQFIMLPMQSMSMASTTFVSQNIGAKQIKRAKHGTYITILLTLIITGAIAAILFIFANASVRLFSSDDAVIEYGILFIRTNTFLLLLNCVCHVLAGALRGLGDSRGPMIIMTGSYVGVRQLYLYVITRFVSNTPRLVGFSYPAGWIVCCIVEVSYYFLVWGRKKEADWYR